LIISLKNTVMGDNIKVGETMVSLDSLSLYVNEPK